MERFNQEQMNVLKEFENNFHTATRSGYSRNVTSDKIRLIENTTGIKCSNMSCSHCVLMFLKTVGERYFYTKENPIVVEMETEPEVAEDTPKTSMEVIMKMVESDPELGEQFDEMTVKNKDTNNEQNGKKRGRPRKDGNI